MQKNNFAFFGTSEFSVIVLNELKKAGLLPVVIVSVEDKPKGRKLVLTPPETKVWAQENNVDFLQPAKLDDEFASKLITYNLELAVVASYGKIIPRSILDIPKHKTLNVHPSLLPKLRGASPIQSAILSEDETGVTIIRLDSEMDHGPIVAQEKVDVINWPPYEKDLEKSLGEAGGKLLVKTIPDWIAGEIEEIPQDHSIATYCKKIEKSDALLDLSTDSEKNLRKIRAYHFWPGAFYFDTSNEKQKRIIIKKAHIEDGKLILDRIVPEGKNEMNYSDYLKGKR